MKRVPLMGHLGLTPQSVHQLGGFRPQDALGLSDTPPPFARQYAQLSEQILSAARAYIEEVRAGGPHR